MSDSRTRRLIFHGRLRRLRNATYVAAFIVGVAIFLFRNFMIAEAWIDVALWPCIGVALLFAFLLLRMELWEFRNEFHLPWVKGIPSTLPRRLLHPALAFLALSLVLLAGIPFASATAILRPIERETEAHITRCSSKYGSYPCIGLPGYLNRVSARFGPDLPCPPADLEAHVTGRGSSYGLFVRLVQPRQQAQAGETAHRSPGQATHLRAQHCLTD